MSRITWLIILIAFFPSLSWAADDECDFDQAERHRSNLALQKKYPGSKFIENKYTLTIFDGADEILLGVGGCVHFGVMIELRTKKTTAYDSDTALLQKIVALAKQYSQGYVDHGVLQEKINAGKWRNIDPKTSNYFMLDYDEFSTFEIYRRNEDGLTIIGLNHYS